MKAIIISLFLLITPAFCLAQDHTPRTNPTPVPAPAPVVARPAADSWVNYKSDAGKYTVLLPGQPTLSTQETASADGVKFPQYLATATTPTAVHMVVHFDLPSPGFSFDRARDLMVNAVNGTLLGESAISLGGYPGREVRMSGRSNEGIDFQVRARIYQIKSRVYMLQYIYQPEFADESTNRSMNRFFDSFSVNSGQ